MTYIADTEQKKVLIEAAREARKRASAERITNDAIKWVSKRHSDFSLSRQTFDRLSNTDQPEVPRYETARGLFEFFSIGPIEYRLIKRRGLGGVISTEEALFADTLISRYSEGAGIAYENLSKLDKACFEGYRPLWVPDGHGFIVLSEIKFYKVGDEVRMTESQQFSFQGQTVSEIDEGPLFSFARCAVALTKSRDDVCLKLYSFHEIDPDLTGKAAIQMMFGNVMAISGTGPHWAGPIFLRRRPSDRTERRSLGIYQVSKLRQDTELKRMFGFFEERNKALRSEAAVIPDAPRNSPA